MVGLTVFDDHAVAMDMTVVIRGANCVAFGEDKSETIDSPCFLARCMDPHRVAANEKDFLNPHVSFSRWFPCTQG
jgi:hypothetical protein